MDDSINYIPRFIGEYRWLSNFYYLETPIVEDGITYRTVEHYFQAHKSIRRNNRVMISELSTPTAAKQRGRDVLLRKDWEEVKLQVMMDGLRLKFSDRNPELKRRLIETGDLELVEGNWHNDRIWGFDLKFKKGQNLLGKLLMEVRDEIR